MRRGAVGAGTVSTEWLLDGSVVPGATGTTYVPPRLDDGHLLACRQTGTGSNGLPASLTSGAKTVYEQPPAPAWPDPSIGCAGAATICIYTVAFDEGAYPHDGDWYATADAFCTSAPWTSIGGDSIFAAQRALAEAHTVTITLERVTATGTVTLASEQVSALGTARDLADGTPSPTPPIYPGEIAISYGSQLYAPTDNYVRYLAPGAAGKPDTSVAGQGLFLYYVPPSSPGMLPALVRADVRADERSSGCEAAVRRDRAGWAARDPHERHRQRDRDDLEQSAVRTHRGCAGR